MPGHRYPALWAPLMLTAGLAVGMLGMTRPVAAQETVAKEVTLIINGRRLIASNVRLSRFDDTVLKAKENIVDKAEDKGVIIIVTNQRILGYGVSSGWRDIKTEAGEEIVSVRAEDFAGFVTSNKRYLNFNGNTGVWAQQDKRVTR